MSGEQVNVISEEDLVKSLTALEDKAAAANVTTEPLVKALEDHTSVMDGISSAASENLAKAIEVSDVLSEFASLMSGQVDNSLEVMTKSINAAAERDYKMIGVLASLKKSIDENTSTLQKLMDQPAAPASSRPVTVASGEVLAKSIGAAPGTQGQKQEMKPGEMRKSVLVGLETLMKNADNASEKARLGGVIVKFESTNQISDTDLNQALSAK